METRITVAELKDSLSDVLKRVCEHGERFVIVEDGKPIATVTRSPETGVPLSVALERIGHLMVPEGFGADLEEIRNSLPPIGEPPSWPD